MHAWRMSGCATMMANTQTENMQFGCTHSHDDSRGDFGSVLHDRVAWERSSGGSAPAALAVQKSSTASAIWTSAQRTELPCVRCCCASGAAHCVHVALLSAWKCEVKSEGTGSDDACRVWQRQETCAASAVCAAAAMAALTQQHQYCWRMACATDAAEYCTSCTWMADHVPLHVYIAARALEFMRLGCGHGDHAISEL